MQMICSSSAQHCSQICSDNKYFTFSECGDAMDLNCVRMHAALNIFERDDRDLILAKLKLRHLFQICYIYKYINI